MKTIAELTDFSKSAEHAAEYACLMADKLHAHILLYHAFYVPLPVPVMTGAPPYYHDHKKTQDDVMTQMEYLSQHLAKKLTKKHIKMPVIDIMSESGTIGDNIDDVIHQKRGITWIVMGDKSKKEEGIGHFISGSDTYSILERTIKPVFLIPEKAILKVPQKIGFATDMAKNDHKYLQNLIDIARIFDAEVIVIHVVTHKLTVEEKVQLADYFNKLKAKTNYDKIVYEDIVGQDVSVALNKFSHISDLDMLAMIHRKYDFFERIFHDSITKKIIKYHHLPLIIFPE